ncbi:MAG: hypothetical protein JWN93_3992 [Hyphomicrobiales bacterium]|nr:hypothetical protein [Hyphomicrobiales bacterium]
MGPSFEKFVPVLHGRGHAPQSGPRGEAWAWAFHALGALVVAAAFLLVPPSVALSAVAPAFLLIGASLAAYAWATGQPVRTEGVSAWDLAGLYVFLGFIAMGLANPDHVAHLF